MTAKTVVPRDRAVKLAIVERLEQVPFERAFEDPGFRKLLDEDCESEQPIYTKESIDGLEQARELRHAKRTAPTTSLFRSNKSVLIVPGFMGCQLRDVKPNGEGLIWIDPKLYVTSAANSSELSALKLADYDGETPEREADGAFEIREDGAVPILYAGLKYYLESGRCEVRTAGFDWRKDIDESAELAKRQIVAYAAEFPGRPLFVIAHSQGSLVARRALQLLGKDTARRLVNRLILIGPASYGTFSAAFALAGNHEMLAQLAGYGFEWPDDLSEVLQSMTGLYQLLPWKIDTVGMTPEEIQAIGVPETWKDLIDSARLKKFFGWGQKVDIEFFNDRTSIILGDKKDTPNGVKFVDGVPVEMGQTQGDGAVPDKCAILNGVNDLARAPGADHMTLPLSHRVMQAVWRMIDTNLTAKAMAFGANGKPKFSVAADRDRGIPELPEPKNLLHLAGVKKDSVAKSIRGGRAKKQVPLVLETPAAPANRRLRVFSYDPLLANDPDSMGLESIVLKLDWDDESADGAKLQPGPVGEYLEVVDYDPASRCFYPPVDLNHPNLLAQDGVPLSEADPRFHQQMVYAVGMAIIAVFERALGRTIQWSPDLRLDENGIKHPGPNGEYVRRLRIYPHAMREPNAYYDPQRKALLFGYFPAKAVPGGRNLPRGTVFTCLSFDVIAHEMTHAVLDGMHRHFLDATNPDVLAFHEAFADIVALFQHFSHPSVLRTQVAKVAGKLEGEGLLGELAQQFGEAIGMHGSLRSYLGDRESGVWKPKKPDPNLLAATDEVHARGAILVAALFTAFQTIYRKRTRDLLRIATRGTGIHPAGDLHPDLVDRLTDEAAKTARHMLTMAIRALDYLPPVDLTFGDYLQALITADADVVPEDGKLYRIAIVDAFRQWGIYPQHVASLSVDSLLWNPPEASATQLEMGFFRDLLDVGGGTLKIDRADMYERQRQVQKQLHGVLRASFLADPTLADNWGLMVTSDAPATIARDIDGVPKFEVHSVRRCRRVGADEQERIDILVEIAQMRRGYFDPAVQARADAGEDVGAGADFPFRGGVTLIVDPRAGRIRYAIRKAIRSDSEATDPPERSGESAGSRLHKVRTFLGGSGRPLGLRNNYFKAAANPFPFLHASDD